MVEDTQHIEVETDTVERIEERVEESDFKTIDEYVNFVLVEVLDFVETEGERGQKDGDVQSRLEDLGYK